VRELENVIERAAILTRGDLVAPDVLPIRPREELSAPRPDNLLVSLEEMEREHIERVLRQTGFHKSRSAEVLGISRKTLDRKIVEYALVIHGQSGSGSQDD